MVSVNFHSFEILLTFFYKLQEKIGQVVMKNLKQLDPIAYLRFASIYKDFQATHQFEEEFKNL